MENRTVVAVHQPNFFPWLGYFDKINKSDVFVFMDDVLFPRTSRGTWQNRVKFLIQGSPRWMTCPVVRDAGEQRIKEVRIDISKSWRKSFLKTLDYNYKKCRYFEEYRQLAADLVNYETTNLTEFNVNSIKQIVKVLGMETTFVFQSKLETSAKATALLIDITRKARGDVYLCGGGAEGYQDDELFSKSDVILEYQGFVHPEYLQVGRQSFFPGLSIWDALFNVGLLETKKLLNW
jgi:hypothetical protein